MFRNCFLCENPVLVRYEEQEQVVLFFCKYNCLAINVCKKFFRNNFNVSRNNFLFPAKASPANKGFNSRIKLREMKWLGEVIIAPRFEAPHAVIDRAERAMARLEQAVSTVQGSRGREEKLRETVRGVVAELDSIFAIGGR